ncbi:hypothetical protein EVAR_13008_1 [Eumeta japonica]|uniref:Uncharacterized protein n=1 Tax=Eumeta variegata TaxID=151549 RepID=A0A4C1TX05_EUMVA|nr:hypothetical protein EVAR_13008_1 [Eumeta japonica]
MSCTIEETLAAASVPGIRGHDASSEQRNFDLKLATVQKGGYGSELAFQESIGTSGVVRSEFRRSRRAPGVSYLAKKSSRASRLWRERVAVASPKAILTCS